MRRVKNEGQCSEIKSKYLWVANLKIKGETRTIYAKPSLEALIGYPILKIKYLFKKD